MAEKDLPPGAVLMTPEITLEQFDQVEAAILTELAVRHLPAGSTPQVFQSLRERLFPGEPDWYVTEGGQAAIADMVADDLRVSARAVRHGGAVIDRMYRDAVEAIPV